MKKLSLLTLLLTGIVFLFLSRASNTQFADDQNLNCGTDQVTEQLFNEQPKLGEKWQQLEEQWVQHQRSNVEKSAPPPYLLPIVFHIVHNNGVENITDATVLAGLDHLNLAYANTDYYDQDTGFVTQIQFCLAHRDPDGNASSGINRINSPLTVMNSSTQDLDLKNLIRWDPTQYLNVWLVREICSNSSGCGVAGYAYLPQSHGNPEDGIVMEARFLGSSEANSAVLIHEVGHYLGLRHTFQGGCTNNDCLQDGDRVCDTPPDQSTAAVPCGGTANSCTTDSNSGFTTDQNDMYINYMDYGDLNCYSAFTQGQSERMWFFIDNVRSSLLDSPACLDPCPNPISASFNADAMSIAVGGTVNFTNTSTNGDHYNWQIDGTTFASTMDAAYTFANTGVFDITLQVSSDNADCFARTFSMQIEVFCPVTSEFAYANDVYVEGASIDFLGQTTAATAFNWTVNAAPAGNTVNLNYTFDQAGIFQVCLEASSDFCSAIYCQYVFIDNTEIPFCEGSNFVRLMGEEGQVEAGNLVIPSNDGNLYLAGSMANNTWIAKVNIDGHVLWQREFNFINTSQTINDLIVDSDGFLVGMGDAGSGNNGRGFIFKYDPVSNALLWVKILNAGTNLMEILEPTTGGPYLLVGNIEDLVNTTDGAAFFEINRNTGNLNGTLNQQYNFGSSDNFITTLVHNNSYFTTGRYTNGAGLENMRMSLSRFTMAGTEQWSYIYNMPFSNNSRLYGRDFLIRDEMIYTTYSGDDNGSSITLTNFFLTKTDLQGTPQWTRKYDIPDYDSEWVEKIVEVSDGLVMMGLSRSGDQQVFLIKTDFEGNVLWAKSYGGEEFEGFVLTTQNNLLALGDNLVFIGQSSSFLEDEDIFLIKTNSEGEINADCVVIEDLQVVMTDIPNLEAVAVNLVTSNSNITLQDGLQNVATVDLEVTTPKFCECNENTNNEDCGDEFFFAVGTDAEEEGIDKVLPLADGRFIAGGYQNNETILFWFDANGNLEKQKQIPFTPLRPRFSDLALDADGFLVGLINTDVIADNRQDIIFKYDLTTDQLIWTRSFNGPAQNRAYLGTFIQHPQNGHYLVFGGTNPSPSPGLGCDAIYLEMDQNSGALLNEHAYNLGSCEAFWKTILWQNDLYHVGRYNFSGGGQNKFRPAMTKMDLNGSEEWSRLYLVNINANARLYNNDFVIEGNTITIVGYGDPFGTSTTNIDLYIFQTDLAGNVLGAKSINIPGVSSEVSIRLQPGPEGYYYLAKVETGGQRENVLMKFDDNLDLQWAKQIGGPGADEPRDLVWSGAYLYLVGRTNSFGSNDDGFIARLTPDGEISGDCSYVETIEVEVTDFNNPYDGLHPLSTYTPSLSFQSQNPDLEDSDLNKEALCTSACPEICDNGIDDDEDGLIDCFDEDCGCTEPCEDYYYEDCPEECVGGPFPGNISIQSLWESEQTVANWDVPVVGDLDADGIPEVVSFRSDGPGFAFDGITGEEKFSYTFPGINASSAYASIGNIDNDPEGEVVIWQNNEIRVYEHDGSLKWAVPRPFSTNLRISGIYDFNEDGIPEIVFGTYIFSSLDGTLLAQGNGASGTNFDYSPIGVVAVADILSEEDCGSPNCRGLELIAGPDIYSVVIASYTDPSLNQIEVVKSLPNYGDGYTSIADFDEDGQLDVIVAGYQRFGNFSRGIYIWNPLTESLVRPFWIYPGGSFALGRPTISNFDNDGDLEVAVHGGTQGEGRLQVIDNDMSLLWSFNTNDNSGATGSSAFDFNGDGQSEVLFRDQTQFRIFKGIDGTVMESFPCTSGTVSDYPVVADINADGQTEIVCNCGGNSDIVNIARVTTWHSAGSPWVTSRPVWNQHTYFNTNVEDNLDIPIQQQQPHLVGEGALNRFLEQYANPDNPLPDATVEVDSLACNQGELLAYFQVCNVGDQVLTYLTPIIVYDNDPRLGPVNALTSGLTLGVNLQPDSCLLITLTLPLLNTEYHVAVNDDGSVPSPYEVPEDFPVTAIAECDYMNNLRGFIFDFTSPILDLGPDIDICENGVFTLDAGDDFANYLWQDGSTETTFTGFEPGTYWVDVLDECGFAQSDTVIVNEIDAPILDIGQDTLICPGDTICLIATGFDTYQWFPPEVVNCPDCDTVKIMTDTALLVRLVGTTQLGCISVDSLQINIGGETATIDTLGLCPGDTLNVFDMPVTTPGTFTDSLYDGSCLVISTIEVIALDTVLTQENLSLCEGDSILVFGEWIVAPGDYSGVFPSAVGCDSTHLVHLEVYPAVFTFDTLIICEGDSVMIFDEYHSEPGDYEGVFQSSVSCDSTSVITLEVLPSSMGSDTLSICPGDSVLIFGEYEQIAGLYTATFDAANGCDSLHETTLEILPASLTFDTLSICAGDSVFLFSNWQSEAGDYIGNFMAANGCDSVVTITLNLLQPTSTAENLTICSGDSILIFGQYENTAGTYTAVFTGANGCDSTHTILLETENITLDYSILVPCTDQNNGIVVIIADGGQGPYTYSWLPGGDLGPIVEHISRGTYSVTVTDAIGCQDSIAFSVNDVEPETFEFVPNRPGCSGDQDGSISLMGTPGMQFSLDGTNFQPVEAFYGLSAGDYLVISEDQNGCRDTMSVVIEDPDPVWVNLPEDQSITLGQTVAIQSQSNVGPAAIYTWKPIDSLSCADCPNIIARPINTTIYTLSVIDTNGCNASDDIRIFVDRRRRVYFPNAFSPNGDGVNDFFTGFADESVRRINHLMIFDRWGELIFEIHNMPLNDPKLGWDGLFNGKAMNSGLFVYLAEVEFVDGSVEVMEGDVLLVR
ncbi:MAG: hypothetical protein DHS20C18_49870 [Saprospiraceae bacterium]|nr:MAG: hypothetical protein DHS20C18_49870 [Saprospiraceae bacterium]